MTHPQKVIQAEEGESILKVDAKVYILRRVNNDVDELNTGHLGGRGGGESRRVNPFTW